MPIKIWMRLRITGKKIFLVNCRNSLKKSRTESNTDKNENRITARRTEIGQGKRKLNKYKNTS